MFVAIRSRVFGEGISALLREAGTASWAGGIEAVMKECASHQPSVLILDDDCVEQIPSDLLRSRVDPAACRILLIIRDPAGWVELAAATGASTWVSRQAMSKELIEAVRALMDGRSARQCPPTSGSMNNDRFLPTELTEREYAVLGLLAQAVSNEVIAQTLGISPNTVRTHVHNVLTKLNVHSRAGAVAWAAQFGLTGTSVARRESLSASR